MNHLYYTPTCSRCIRLDAACYTQPQETAMPEPVVNPKALRAAADGKAPLDYLEPACDDGEARVMKGGAEKYGRRNYRDTEMLWTTYLGSMRRHLNALARGEDHDPDTGEHHLYHIRANTAVLLGAMDAGTLKDDRHDMVSTPLSDAVHIGGNMDAKGLTAEYNRGIDELAEELRAESCCLGGELTEECLVGRSINGKCAIGPGPVIR